MIGRELPEALLREVAELPEAELRESAARLVGAELLVEASLYPRLAYAFKHPLTRDVAYQAQLASRRARLQAVVARALVEHEQGAGYIPY